MDEIVQNQLQAYYRERLPGMAAARITGVEPLTEGWESIIYAFELAAGPGEGSPAQGLILRLYPGSDASFKSKREFEGMQVLHRLGYPVPQVFHLEREYSPFGRPFVIMERIAGEMLWRVLDRAAPERANALITRFCELFVQLHALDWRAFAAPEQQAAAASPYHYVDQFLAMLYGAAQDYPALDGLAPLFQWLETRRDGVPCPRPAPVHWDLHPGNVLLCPDGRAVVIDWTQIQVSDARFDLGWTLLLTGVYAGEPLRDRFLAEYQRIAGAPVEQLEFFEVAACVKRLGTMMISLAAGADQMGMRPETAAIMRRDFPAFRRVYALMAARTGLCLPEIEALLAG
jgi:aminoglycoside phosphotransferase (APT) family kinase protein